MHAFIRGWLDGLGGDTEHPNDPHAECSFPMPDLDDENGGNELVLPNKRDYTKIVFESAAYLWLTASLKRELSLAPVPGQEEACGRIYSEVVRHLETGRREVSSHRPSERYVCYLVADWSPIAFLTQQFGDSSEPPGQTFARTITLTGSATDAQAATCEMYVRQTWPASGPGLLSIFKRVRLFCVQVFHFINIE